MLVKSSNFVCSSSNISQCPNTNKPEYAFTGRSNVGKSSLINMLVGNRKLAKTSSTPGKTQLINHFLINDLWYLVDLPGYGYAKVSKSNRYQWGKMMEEYLIKRENLVNIFVLVDSRLETQRIDLDFINWLGQNGIPFSIVFTKTDKLSRNQIQKNVSNYKRTLGDFWEYLPKMFETSSIKKTGKEEILDYVDLINESYIH